MLGMNNTTKHIMNNFVILSQATSIKEEYKCEKESIDHRVVQMFSRVLGQRNGVFSFHGNSGTCRLLGQPLAFSNSHLDRRLLEMVSQSSGLALLVGQAFYFRRARVETGIHVRGTSADPATCRNESVVMDCDNTVIRVAHVIGIVDVTCTEVIGTFAAAGR